MEMKATKKGPLFVSFLSLLACLCVNLHSSIVLNFQR